MFRLNVIAAAHPRKIIAMLREESSTTSSDGFMSRFLICCPQPSRQTLKSLTVLGKEKLSLAKLFATIKILHSEATTFKLTGVGFDYLSECLEDYDMISEKNERTTPFLRY